MPQTRRQTLGLLTATSLALLGGPALAQGAGEKTVRFVLPNAVSSGVDTITRTAQPPCPRRSGIR